jgi:hypothetical protein
MDEGRARTAGAVRGDYTAGLVTRNAGNAQLKRSLTEQGLKNIKWCGTPMVDGANKI